VDDILLPDGTIEGFEGGTPGGTVIWGCEPFVPPSFPEQCGFTTIYTTTSVSPFPGYWSDVPLANSGSHAAYLTWGYSNEPQNEYLISPPFAIPAGKIGVLSFENFVLETGVGYVEQDLVEAWGGTPTVLGDMSVADNQYAQTVMFVLPGDATNVVFHRVTPSSGWGPWAVDDICVDVYAGGAYLCQETFEPWDTPMCFEWNSSATCAGDFWEFTSAQPWGTMNDYDGDGMNWFCHGYPEHGKGLNDVLYTEVNLTDPALIFAQLEFAYSFYTEDGCAAYIEISANWDGVSDIESATWATYWSWVSSGYWATNGWVPISIDVSDYIGQKIHLRFRYTTPGNDLFIAAPPNNGWAVDGFMMNYKEITFTDDIPPVTTLVFDDLTGTVSLFAYDPTGPVSSGVCFTYYKLNGGSQTEYDGPITLSEGAHTVEYWSVDCAGNEESHKNSPTLVVDTTPPTIEITEPIEGLYLFGSKILASRILGSGALCIGKITIKATASDTGTGIKFVTFDIDGDSGYDATAPYEYLYRGPKFGSATVTATAYDLGGLDAQDTATFTIYSLGIL
jgi:hypothetical protein